MSINDSDVSTQVELVKVRVNLHKFRLMNNFFTALCNTIDEVVKHVPESSHGFMSILAPAIFETTDFHNHSFPIILASGTSLNQDGLGQRKRLQ